MKHILCYGDSNTWGLIPGTMQRYPEDVRWTQTLQRELGRDYRVLEDGISGRTVAFDVPDLPYLNGKYALGYSLLASSPLDLVIVCLGTNDLKYASIEQSARELRALVARLLDPDRSFSSITPIFRTAPRVLIVCPGPLHPDIFRINPTSLLREHYEKSLLMAPTQQAVASELGVHFLDAAPWAVPSDVDGIHLTTQSHLALGKAVAEKVRDIFSQMP